MVGEALAALGAGIDEIGDLDDPVGLAAGLLGFLDDFPRRLCRYRERVLWLIVGPEREADEDGRSDEPEWPWNHPERDEIRRVTGELSGGRLGDQLSRLDPGSLGFIGRRVSSAIRSK